MTRTDLIDNISIVERRISDLEATGHQDDVARRELTELYLEHARLKRQYVDKYK